MIALFAQVFAVLAALIGAGMGLKAALDPAWVSRLVRLVPDPQKAEGQAELRATYGGLFTAGHGFGAAAVVFGGAPGAWSAAAIGAGWAGAGLVRLAHARADGAVTSYNLGGAGFELAMGAALLSPWVVDLARG